LAVSSASVFNEVKRIQSAGNMPLIRRIAAAMKRSGFPDKTGIDPDVVAVLMAITPLSG
jgi:hypothetical protein